MVRLSLLALALALSSAGAASATTLSLTPLKCKDNCAVLGSQLTVEVLDAGPGKVSFRLFNEGSESLTASQIFFDDTSDVLLDLLDVADGAGVDFAEGGKPDNLKGGKKIDFFADFLATAAKPNKDNGVSDGETLVVNFMLTGGNSLEDVLAALGSGDLRIGVNAKQGFVTAGGVVPEPSALMLLALGGVAAAWVSRRS